MFLGHYGVALAAKGLDKKTSLGTMFIASQFIDLIWPLFVVTGIEKVKIEVGNTVFTPLNFVYYPFSHSLGAVLLWALLFGAVFYAIKRRMRSSVILSFLVISHWLLDYLTHKPDLPLFPWTQQKVGLGLWNSFDLTIIVEMFIFTAGAVIYFLNTHSHNEKGFIGIWTMLVFLTAIYFLNIFGPPPPSDIVVGYMGFALWIFVVWAYWTDKYRSPGRFSKTRHYR